MNWILRFALAAILAAATLCPALATAQDEEPAGVSYGNDSVKARFVGVSGGVIAGAELVVAVEAIIGVKPLWPYLTFPLLGAAGGGVGGYYLEDASEKGAVALLIGSMALVIPTILAASAARAYDPEDEGELEEETSTEFSFEATPTAEEEAGGTSTEVESRPEGAPPEALPPPGAGDEPAEPSEPETETDEGGEASGEGDVSTSGLSTSDPAARSARLRRATAGSLFYVDSDGTPGLSMPHIDIRPTTLSSQDAFLTTRRGVEVYVPLLRVDLP